jgi:proline dehydrogenase
MSLLRSAILKASENAWLRERAPHFGFIRRSVERFMPGERVDDALAAANRLAGQGITTLLTHLGENVASREEAEAVAQHYITLLDCIRSARVPSEVSVKLTQLGLDIDKEFCFRNLSTLVERSPADKTLWIDMEQSSYVDATLDLFGRLRGMHGNCGVCVQAYLRRTKKDVESLIAMGSSVRLVKGAYNEPPETAFPKKADVDENYFALVQMLLGAEARTTGVRVAIATHDQALIERTKRWAAAEGIAKDQIEFAMLYGIQRAEQLRLAREGYRSCVLVSYGSFWFPWFMRRLAERPANLTFLVRNIFSQ